ncbi:MAG: N-acetylmuramidase, partial [Bacteroidetes bacterium]|nr:N-acetylmuramidase [Bacteroidota bacterium]
MFVRIISLLFVGLLLFSSCKSKKKIVSTNKNKKTERVIISNQKESKTATLPVKKEASANASYNEIVSIYIENYSIIAKDEM